MILLKMVVVEPVKKLKNQPIQLFIKFLPALIGQLPNMIIGKQKVVRLLALSLNTFYPLLNINSLIKLSFMIAKFYF